MKKIFMFLLCLTQIHGGAYSSQHHEELLVKLIDEGNFADKINFTSLPDSLFTIDQTAQIEAFNAFHCPNNYLPSATNMKLEDSKLTTYPSSPKSLDQLESLKEIYMSTTDFEKDLWIFLKKGARRVAQFLDGSSNFFPILSKEGNFYEMNLASSLNAEALLRVREVIKENIKNYFSELTFEKPFSKGDQISIPKDIQDQIKETMEMYHKKDLIMYWLCNPNQHFDSNNQIGFNRREELDFLNFIKAMKEMDAQKTFNGLMLGLDLPDSEKNIALLKEYIASGSEECLDKIKDQSDAMIKQNLGIVIRKIKNCLALVSRVCTRNFKLVFENQVENDHFRIITGRTIQEFSEKDETPWFINPGLFQKIKEMKNRHKSSKAKTVDPEQKAANPAEESNSPVYGAMPPHQNSLPIFYPAPVMPFVPFIPFFPFVPYPLILPGDFFQ